MLYNYGAGPDQLNRSGWNSIVNQMSPAAALTLDYTPDRAYEMWLRALGVSNTQERTLRSAYNSIFNNYEGQRMLGYPKNTLRWVDYLKQFDPNKELARLAPAARYEDASKFLRPARVVAF